MDWIGLISFGILLSILGAILMKTPELTHEVRAFILDFHLEKVRFLTFDALFPAPEHSHPIVYKAIMELSFAYSASHVLILAMRFIFKESINRKADSVSSMLLWMGVGYFANMLFREHISWFGFIGGIILCAGASIILGSLIKLMG